MTVQVMIVDDHPVVRVGMRAILDAFEGFEWVGEASDGDEAIAVCGRTQPDLVILDVRMADRDDDGLRVIGALKEGSPHTRILMVSRFADDETVLRAIVSGADGFCVKHADPESLLRAAQAVSRGESIFGSGVAERIRRLVNRQDASQLFPGLTRRQREVVEMMAAGKGDGAIGTKLGISRKTVQNHVSAVVKALQVSNRDEALRRVRDTGIGSSSDGTTRRPTESAWDRSREQSG